MASTAVPTEDGSAYILNGRKLWATNGVGRRSCWSSWPTCRSRRGTRAASARSSSRPTAPGIAVERRNAFMGLRGHRELADELHKRPGAGREPASAARDAASRSHCRPSTSAGSSLPAICAAQAKWALGRSSVSGRTSVCSGAAASAGTTPSLRRSPSWRRRRTRSRRSLEMSSATRRRQAQRHPDRGGARQALGVGDGVADRRRARPDPRRPWLRDRGVPDGPGRAADPGRADDAGHADQPDLRGISGDHEPVHRPRGGRPRIWPWPATSSSRRRSCEGKAKAAGRPAASTPSGSRSSWWARA